MSASATSQAAPRRRFRQPGAVTLGVFTILVCGFMLISGLVTRSTGPGFDGVMVLGLVAGWSLCVRPSVEVSLEGVTLRNPYRDTTVPWALVDGAGGRWNLELWLPEHSGLPDKLSAWAVAAHVKRPRGGGLLSVFGSFGRAGAPARSETDPKPTVTVGGVAQVIESGREEYAELLAAHEVAPPEQPRLLRRWVWPDLAATALGVVLVVLGLMGY